MIHVVGPWGAGKTTAGSALARRLGMAFVDLDEQFTAGAGDISAYLDAHGYAAYAGRNIQVYLDTIGSLKVEAVIALSSGFITYPDGAHSVYRKLRQEIIASSSTLVLLPSFDHETCVAETVSRQLRRPFSRSAEREEQVIRARFSVYFDLPVKKFETKEPVEVLVDDLIAHLLPNIGLEAVAAAVPCDHLTEPHQLSVERDEWPATASADTQRTLPLMPSVPQSCDLL